MSVLRAEKRQNHVPKSAKIGAKKIPKWRQIFFEMARILKKLCAKFFGTLCDHLFAPKRTPSAFGRFQDWTTFVYMIKSGRIGSPVRTLPNL